MDSVSQQQNRPRSPFRRLRRLAIGLGILVALWLCISLAVAHRLTLRPRALFAEPAPTVRWGKIESVRLRTRDGHDIGGWLVPREDDAPTVLLLHGNKGSRRNSLARAEQFCTNGCAVLMLTLRAHGDSSGDRNDIGFSARHDVVAAIEYLERARPGRPIIVHGVSMGAAAAIFSSSELATRVHGYILEAPYRDLKTAVRNRTREALPPVLEWIAYQGLLIVTPLVLPHVDAISPLKAIDGVPEATPVLIFAGGQDRSARIEEARAIHDRVKSHAQLVVFDSAGHHNLLATDPDRYWKRVGQFLQSVIKRHADGHTDTKPAQTAASYPITEVQLDRAGSEMLSENSRKREVAMPRILHILKRTAWEAALREGVYRPDSLRSEGFIHCSTPEQLIRTANLYFAGHSDLVVLNIDPALVHAPLRWELPHTSESPFPHIYGALNLDAVIGIQTLIAGPSEEFQSVSATEEFANKR